MNRALRSAYLKGLDAGLLDEPVTACPYSDRRKQDGRLTFSRAFRHAWQEGWRHAQTDREDALITAQYGRPS